MLGGIGYLSRGSVFVALAGTNFLGVALGIFGASGLSDASAAKPLEASRPLSTRAPKPLPARVRN